MQVQSLIIYIALLFAFFAVAFAANGSSTYTYQHQGSNAFSLALGLNTTGNDLYFNMSAPSTYSWFAFGIGGQMKNSLMFIGYPSSNGTGVTLSPRLSTGHQQPQYTSSKNVQVKSSSITNGAYQLMGVCYNCTTWSLGTMDTTSTQQPFIFALGPTGETISSDSTSQNIDQHTLYNSFSMDMTQAAFSGSNTPSLNSGSNAASSSGASGSSSASTGASTGGGDNTYNRVHGIFMAIAFVILFPLGVLVLRLGHSVIGHGIVQATAYCFVIVGLGTGIYLSQQQNFSGYNTAHQIIGLVLFSLLAIQALGGLIHHLLFRRGHKTIIGKVHMFLGIGLIILGIVNVPLGLNLAGDSNYNKYYIIVVCILGALFLALRFWALWRDRKSAKREGSEKGVLRRGSSSEEAVM
ncbi:CBD9-like protein [Aureobasidium sp. EXF-10727]|nr:CBD9-like protein [Aureobasidium sp. EXF-10727]